MSFFPHPLFEAPRMGTVTYNGELVYAGPIHSALVSEMNHMFPAKGLVILSTPSEWKELIKFDELQGEAVDSSVFEPIEPATVIARPTLVPIRSLESVPQTPSEPRKPFKLTLVKNEIQDPKPD